MALNGKGRELDVFLDLEGITWTVPGKIFASGSSVKMIRLESDSCFDRFLVPHRMVLAPNLITLELIKVELPKGDSKGELVLVCPLLETLNLVKCIYSHLKVFNLSEIDNNGYTWADEPFLLYGIPDCKLELHSPNLSTFVYKGVMYKDCSFGNLAALINVDIFLCQAFIKGLSNKCGKSRYVKLLEGLNGARTLALRKIEIRSEVPDKLEELLTLYSSLRKLELEASSHCHPCHTWLASLLCHCSSIETLVLNAIPFCPSEEDELALPLCSLNCLKYIAIRRR